ncbi:MAG: T9SS type A sorting domain-containing protein [Bacteroidetes bacterium]|nr:T9SS type A sorting domain-containing protein [Bacteroidota bacterium]
MKKLLLCFSLFIASINAFAQQDLYCGADEMRINTLKANPKVAEAVIKRDIALETYTQEFTQNFYQKKMTGGMIYTIPVVFHVIHMYGNENISNAQIYDGINVLNKTFRKQSADTASIIAAFKPIHADCEIEFRLATLDPNGNCTSGINRIASPLTATGDHAVKSLIQWDPSKYLNIYVVQNAAGLAGHAVWPADADSIPAWDGIVISHDYVGSIGTSNPTRSVVLAHECGHYLNLQHIWGGNNVPNFYYYPCADPFKDCNIDDLVADTPPTIGWQSCNLSGASCGNMVDNVQNAMDYSYCNKMFTYGQKARMQACLNDTMANRNNLWQPANLIATGVASSPGTLCGVDFTANKKVVCANSNNQITFTNTSFNGNFTSVEWTFPGGTPSTSSLAGPTVTYATVGKYDVTLKVKNGVDSLQTTKTDFISVLPSTGNPYPFSEGFESLSDLNGNEWFSNSFDQDNDWQITSTTSYSGSKSVMINNFSNTQSTKDELISPIIDLTGTNNLAITFKYAFAKKDSSNTDQLQLLVSNNCNNTWTSRLNLTGTNLETAPITTNSFTPSSLSEWKSGYATIPNTYLNSSFRMKFIYTSKGGNNIFLDDINIQAQVGIEDIDPVIGLSIFPNPGNEQVNVLFELNQQKKITINIYNILGELIESTTGSYSAGEQKISLSTRNYPNGYYTLNLSCDKQVTIHPLIINQ